MSAQARGGPVRGARGAHLAVILVAAGVYGWTLSLGLSTLEPFDDYTVHNRLARQMADRRGLVVPHPLYSLLALGADAILPGGIAVGGFAIALLAQVALAALLFEWLRRAGAETGGGGGTAQAALLTAAVMAAAPVNVFTPGPGDAYFGYFPPNTLHSPTTVLVRPLSLALFAAVVAGSCAGARTRHLVAVAALAALCGLAKPSYLSCLAPALVLAWLLGGTERAAARKIAFAVGLPAAALLAFQVWFTLKAETLAPSSILVRPFEYLAAHTSVRPSSLAFKLALSVAFPLVLTAAHAPRTLRDAPLRVSWMAFAIGVLQAYMLTESGTRGRHGNFTWGAQVAAFVLFAASARWWLRHGRGGPRPFLAGSACALALSTHVVVGLAELGRFARSGPPFAPAVHDRGERP